MSKVVGPRNVPGTMSPARVPGFRSETRDARPDQNPRSQISLRNIVGLARWCKVRATPPYPRFGLCYIGARTVFRFAPGAKLSLGRGVLFIRDARVDVGGTLTIGNGVSFSWGCQVVCHESVEIGDYTMFGAMCSIHDENHIADRDQRPLAAKGFRTGPIKIGRNVWVGEKATILQGVTIGDGAVIGAHAVVNRDVPAYTVVAGVPARVIREIAE